jgi:hypothetical protein
LLAGISDTNAKPVVFCVDSVTRHFRRFERTFAGRVTSHGIPASSPAEFARNVDNAIDDIKEQHQIDAWDAVLIDGSVATHQDVIGSGLQLDFCRARLIVFEGINNIGIFENHDRLLKDPNYVLAAHNPGLRNGYAIFKRNSAAAGLNDERHLRLAKVCG